MFNCSPRRGGQVLVGTVPDIENGLARLPDSDSNQPGPHTIFKGH